MAESKRSGGVGPREPGTGRAGSVLQPLEVCRAGSRERVPDINESSADCALQQGLAGRWSPELNPGVCNLELVLSVQEQEENVWES